MPTVRQNYCTPNSLPQFCQILNDLQNSFTGRVPNKFAVKWLLWFPTHFAYVATSVDLVTIF